MANSIFRKQSLDRVNSPEELNDYIKTSTPSVWLIVFAAIILLLSVLVWAFFASLDTTVTLNGVAKNGNVICFADSTNQIEVGDEVKIGSVKGKVSAVSQKPVSQQEAETIADTDDYTLYCLNLTEWNYIVEVDIDGTTEDGYVTADIIVEKTSPVSFIFG